MRSFPYAVPSALLLVMGICDLGLTLCLLESGVEEWNQLLAAALRHSVELFFVVKLGLNFMSSALLFFVPHKSSIADFAVLFCAGVYAAVFASHQYAFSLL